MVADLYKGRWQIELFFKWIKRKRPIGDPLVRFF
jgi:IS4 transposase